MNDFISMLRELSTYIEEPTGKPQAEMEVGQDGVQKPKDDGNVWDAVGGVLKSIGGAAKKIPALGPFFSSFNTPGFGGQFLGQMAQAVSQPGSVNSRLGMVGEKLGSTQALQNYLDKVDKGEELATLEKALVPPEFRVAEEERRRKGKMDTVKTAIDAAGTQAQIEGTVSAEEKVRLEEQADTTRKYIAELVRPMVVDIMSGDNEFTSYEYKLNKDTKNWEREELGTGKKTGASSSLSRSREGRLVNAQRRQFVQDAYKAALKSVGKWITDPNNPDQKIFTIDPGKTLSDVKDYMRNWLQGYADRKAIPQDWVDMADSVTLPENTKEEDSGENEAESIINKYLTE